MKNTLYYMLIVFFNWAFANNLMADEETAMKAIMQYTLTFIENSEYIKNKEVVEENLNNFIVNDKIILSQNDKNNLSKAIESFDEELQKAKNELNGAIKATGRQWVKLKLKPERQLDELDGSIDILRRKILSIYKAAKKNIPDTQENNIINLLKDLQNKIKEAIKNLKLDHTLKEYCEEIKKQYGDDVSKLKEKIKQTFTTMESGTLASPEEQYREARKCYN